jgi:hypothetical protein
MRKLKLWNGCDWNSRGGTLYVCAYSWKDALDLANQAYRSIKGLVDRPDVAAFSMNYLKTYWCRGTWGTSMKGIVPVRGVWWSKKDFGVNPERLI